MYNTVMSFDPLSLLAVLTALLLGLTLHEFMHAYTSNQLGDETAHREGRLTLNPAAHIDPVFTLLLPLITYLTAGVALGAAKPVPFNPWALRGGKYGSALVAAAGPFTNLLIALVFALALFLINPGPLGSQFIGTIIAVNVALFVFNLIPFPPLDGSRVLYAFVPYRVREVMDRIEQAGLLGVFLLLLLLFYTPLGNIFYGIIRGIVRILAPVPGF